MDPNFENNIPIYLQLVEKIKIDIISGALSPGERLPSVRDWALLAKVNPNTMQKALSELEEMGLVFTERTNGKFVTSDLDLISRFKNDHANKIADGFFESMRKIGYDENEAIGYLQELGGDLS